MLVLEVKTNQSMPIAESVLRLGNGKKKKLTIHVVCTWNLRHSELKFR